MANLNKREAYSKSLYIAIVVLIILFIADFIYGRYNDKLIANRVYDQLVTIDRQLDNLQDSAQQIVAQKNTNSQIIDVVKGLTKDNFVDNKQTLLISVAKLDYNPAVKAKLESEIAAANKTNVKLQLKQINMTLRELKYQHNLEVKAFNSQIEQVTSQVASVKTEIMKIHGENMQRLELAKLDFITRKLTKTAHEIHQAFYTSLIDEVLDTAFKDGTESK